MVAEQARQAMEEMRAAEEKIADLALV